jgi:hypothetical protein
LAARPDMLAYGRRNGRNCELLDTQPMKFGESHVEVTAVIADLLNREGVDSLPSMVRHA